ncbi:hypothetical protein PG985_013737 [Apiospora marii]|uniref:uncharacterized protein n=1 Tax=Apiospora marii TaxID=335849 RepID=UPI003131A655
MKLLTVLMFAASALSAPMATINTGKRDGLTEFDTDLCVLRREEAKRSGVAGVGINNCDF